MFDSRSLRRKLGNLIPGENARNHLQNVLTVEWDTHKTVLVDVPGARPDMRSPDVEMEGMGLNRRDEREGYGRLGDDGDDYLDSPYSNRDPNLAIDSPTFGPGAGGSYFDRPWQPSRSHSYNSDKRLPAVPHSPAQRSERGERARGHDREWGDRDDEALNPFVSADDFAPGVQPSPRRSQFLQPERERNSNGNGSGARPQQARSRTTEEGWHTFSTPSGNGSASPALGSAAHLSHTRGVKEPTSPSSSRGTRDSAQTNSTSDENPFR